MKNAIILHGKPDKDEYYLLDEPNPSNRHWIPWLQKQLLINDIKADTPEVPRPYKPQWDLWVTEVERFEIGPETILVGHSCGGGFWVRYLNEHKNLKVGKVVLVAPWIDPDRENTTDFFDFSFDPELASRTKGLVIFHSDDDLKSVHKSEDEINKKVKNIRFKEFRGYGHFTSGSMKNNKFPELLEECLR